MSELVVENLSLAFADNPVLHDLSFTVRDGEFFTLLGPSGCGKSTTLFCVAGLERPDGGSIRLNDVVFVDGRRRFIPPEGRNLGMVFQTYALWPHMTVADNLALPLRIRKVARRERDRMIDDSLDKVGLLELRGRYPHQLSGGQQQRVALARALVYSPRLLLLDEPLSNLDAKLREQARKWIKRLQVDLGITTVYVTHDQHEALSLSDRIAVMSGGRMLQVGTPTEIYETPTRPEVASLLGQCNMLPGRLVEAGGARWWTVVLDCGGASISVTPRAGLAAGDRVIVAVRPENVSVARAADVAESESRNVLRDARVVQVAYVGARYEYELSVADHPVLADSDHPDVGDGAALLIDPAHCLIHPLEGLPPGAAATDGDDPPTGVAPLPVSLSPKERA